MRPYDRSLPLIVVHIPKAAGQSTRELFRSWFPGSLYENYFDEHTGTLPLKLDLPALQALDGPVAVYGHFNRQRGFGIDQYYPDVAQFITILRDPFELAISSYFFLRKAGTAWRDQTRVPRAGLREYLRDTPPNMLNHFPRVVTRDNYRDLIEQFFVEIGVMDHFNESMRRIAEKLSKPFDPGSLPHLNATLRDQAHPGDLREEYAERHPLEFAVYSYVSSRFAGATGDAVIQQSALEDVATARN